MRTGEIFKTKYSNSLYWFDYYSFENGFFIVNALCFDDEKAYKFKIHEITERAIDILNENIDISIVRRFGITNSEFQKRFIGRKLIMSKFLNLNIADILKGGITAFLASSLSGVYGVIQSGALPSLDQLATIGGVGLTAGAGYLLKNVFTNSNGVPFSKEPR
jgi:hypothetical protein